jgi:hypothetical protein
VKLFLGTAACCSGEIRLCLLALQTHISLLYHPRITIIRHDQILRGEGEQKYSERNQLQ